MHMTRWKKGTQRKQAHDLINELVEMVGSTGIRGDGKKIYLTQKEVVEILGQWFREKP